MRRKRTGETPVPLLGQVELLPAIFRGTPANPAGEGVGKDKRLAVADFVRNGLDGLFRGGQQFGGAAHAHVNDLVHGTASELTAAEPAQMLVAVTGLSRQARKGPIV